eukprot:6197534-Prymnesium_polylepis.5
MHLAQRRGEEAAARGWRDQPDQREQHRDNDHARELHAAADDGGEQHRVRRRAEHVRVAVLPAHLLQQLVDLLHIVALQVAPHRADEDGSDDSREQHRGGE